jgi:quercetin dioxygenase-like cupin family protein
VPVVHAADAVVHELHGSVFASYAAPASGSRELCAWRLEVPAGAAGVAHTVSREEVLLVLSGSLRVTLDGGAELASGALAGGALAGGAQAGGAQAGGAEPADSGLAAGGAAGSGRACDAVPGDAIVVPAGAALRIDNPAAEPASAWVTTSVGLEAVLPDGSRISPPWVR